MTISFRENVIEPNSSALGFTRELLRRISEESVRNAEAARKFEIETAAKLRAETRAELEAEFITALQAVHAERKLLAQTLRREALAAVVEITEAVTGAELSQNRRSINARLARALSSFHLKGAKQLRVNAADSEALDPELLAALGCELIVDASVDCGEAVIFLDLEHLIVSPRLQLASILSALREK